MYQTITDSTGIARDELGFPGVTVQLLSGDGMAGGMYILTTMAPGSAIPAHKHTNANEFVYVVSGDFVEAGKSYRQGTIFFGAAGTPHGPHSTATGCVVLTHYSGPLDFQPVS